MPNQVTPQFVMDLESRARIIQVNEYQRVASSDNIWWDLIAKTIPSGSRREIFNWILSTALIEDQGEGGSLAYDNMYIQEAEYVNKTAGKGIKIRRQQFEDLDGNGVQLMSKWVSDVSGHAGYWPQQQIRTLLEAGESTLAYDAVNYFSINHPTNPFDTGAGFYANLFTGTAGSAGANAADLNKAIYPGAVNVNILSPVAAVVDAVTALKNLITAFTYIRTQRMPNGVLPRMLTPRFLLAPAALHPALVQITGAKFLAQAVGSAGGSADVQSLIASMGFGVPVLGKDLIDQTAFYIFCEEMTNTDLGAFGYMNREPFSIRYYTGRGGGTGTDLALDIKDELEWHTSGRNVAIPGHPWVCYKCKAT